VAVRIERTGAERVFQRIGQERASNIFACDVAQSSDAAHYIAWKREGALAPCVPEDVAKHFLRSTGTRTAFRLMADMAVRIAYNTKLVTAQEAPRASPTCSTRNGRASWSRRIPATAARC